MSSAFRIPFYASVFLLAVGAVTLAQTSTVDPTYNAVPSLSVFPPDNVPSVLRQAVQADGKILVWGGALTIEGVAKPAAIDSRFGGVQWGLSTDVEAPKFVHSITDH